MLEAQSYQNQHLEAATVFLGCDVQAAETLLPEEHNYVTPKRTASPQIMKQKDQKNNRRKDDVAQKMFFYEGCFRQEDPEILEKTKAKRSQEPKV